MSRDTIFALSSGLPPSGVAIIRISGPRVRFAFETLTNSLPAPRLLALSNISTHSGELLDRGLIVFFPGPNSFTGEDCGEFHIHGSRAVLNGILTELASFSGFRFADAGEFSRRAFENGRLDLTEVEGLSDLINANTECQRKLALAHSSGELRLLYNGWRDRLIKLRAYIEAGFDFSEEDDIPDDVFNLLSFDILSLVTDITEHLATYDVGEIIRDGFKVSLIGAPNSGKSSLLNALAKRDVAIVSEIAGTTRDIVSVSLNLNGYEVIVSDTAGIRDTDDLVENLGIKRTFDCARKADLVLVLNSVDDLNSSKVDLDLIDNPNCQVVFSKVDLVEGSLNNVDELRISSVSGEGLSNLVEFVSNSLTQQLGTLDSIILTRMRHKVFLENTLSFLNSSLLSDVMDSELLTEDLRLAADQLGRIVGKIDVEDLLDVIFGEFCVGK